MHGGKKSSLLRRYMVVASSESRRSVSFSRLCYLVEWISTASSKQNEEAWDYQRQRYSSGCFAGMDTGNCTLKYPPQSLIPGYLIHWKNIFVKWKKNALFVFAACCCMLLHVVAVQLKMTWSAHRSQSWHCSCSPNIIIDHGETSTYFLL